MKLSIYKSSALKRRANFYFYPIFFIEKDGERMLKIKQCSNNTEKVFSFNKANQYILGYSITKKINSVVKDSVVNNA